MKQISAVLCRCDMHEFATKSMDFNIPLREVLDVFELKRFRYILRPCYIVK